MKKDLLKNTVCTGIILLIAVMLLYFSQEIRNEILHAFSLAVQTVIPGLFPFLVLSQTVCATGIWQTESKRVNRITQVLFSMPANCIAPIVFGLTGGYLAGIKTVRSMYDNGEISTQQARNLARFCFSPGPAFAIGAVGKSMLGNAKSGVLLFVSCSLSALFFLVYAKHTECVLSQATKKSNDLFVPAFVRAVRGSADSCVSLTAWMAVFACVQAVILQLIPDCLHGAFLSVAEVTGGVLQAQAVCSLPLCAAVLGFGGLCIFCQILPDLQVMHISPFLFLKNRALQALLSALFCRIGLFFFPTADLSRPTVQLRLFRTKPVVSLFLLFVCYIFILDLAPREKTWYTDNGR